MIITCIEQSNNFSWFHGRETLRIPTVGRLEAHMPVVSLLARSYCDIHVKFIFRTCTDVNRNVEPSLAFNRYVDIDWFKNLNEIIIECVINILMEFLFVFWLMDFHADQHGFSYPFLCIGYIFFFILSFFFVFNFILSLKFMSLFWCLCIYGPWYIAYFLQCIVRCLLFWTTIGVLILFNVTVYGSHKNDLRW